MEFWGIEIKPGKPVKVEPEDGYLIHVSQVALGELKNVKGENVPVYVKVGDDKTKLIVGSLSQKNPQISLDLFFEQEFEVSHECENSSVFLLGYQSPDFSGDHEEIDSDEEEIPMDVLAGLNDEKVKLEEAGESDSDESDSEEADEMDSDEDDEEEEEIKNKKKVEPLPPSKKTPNGGAMNNKTVASKKAKAAIPQKSSGGKKSGKCQGPCGSSCKN